MFPLLANNWFSFCTVMVEVPTAAALAARRVEPEAGDIHILYSLRSVQCGQLHS